MTEMDKYREPERLEMIAVPRWLLEGSVMCAIYTSRAEVMSDGMDILNQIATEILERAPCDVDDLTAQYDGTGNYADAESGLEGSNVSAFTRAS